MANTGDITAQINKIYSADVTSIRNLTEISKKLQEGKLSIPGNLTIEGKLFAERDSDMRLLKASRIILYGRDISNQLNRLDNQIRFLRVDRITMANKLANTERKLSNLPRRLRNLESRFPNAQTIVLGDARLIDGSAGDRFVYKNSGQNNRESTNLKYMSNYTWIIIPNI